MLDIAEAIHQAEESETALVALAALVACLHAGAAFGALVAAHDEHAVLSRREA